MKNLPYKVINVSNKDHSISDIEKYLNTCVTLPQKGLHIIATGFMYEIDEIIVDLIFGQVKVYVKEMVALSEMYKLYK